MAHSNLPTQIDGLPNLTVVRQRGVVDPKVVLKGIGYTLGCVFLGGLPAAGLVFGFIVYLGVIAIGALIPALDWSSDVAQTAGTLAGVISIAICIVYVSWTCFTIEPVILAPEAAFRRRMDWNWLARMVCAGLPYVSWIGVYVLAQFWSSLDVLIIIGLPLSTGIIGALLGPYLFSEDKDLPPATEGEQMKGYRLICMMDAEEYERKRDKEKLSQDELAFALGQHLVADDCEIAKSNRPSTMLVIFRWYEHPQQHVIDRIKRIPSRFLSGKELRLLLFGKEDRGRTALPE